MKRNLTVILIAVSANFASAKSWMDDFSPSLFATSSVQVVEALSNAIPSVSSYIPKTKAEMSGEYSYLQGVDGGNRLYLFADDTYMRVNYYSFRPMRIDDKGTWELKEGRVRMKQTENYLTNNWMTSELELVPIKNGKDTFLIGAHWGFSLVNGSAKHDLAGDSSLFFWGHRREKLFDSDSSAREKNSILKQWEKETSRCKTNDVAKPKDDIHPGGAANPQSPSAQGADGR
jgi:hypothetical protein